MNVDLNAATTHDLLERYVAEMDVARFFVENRCADESRLHRENAEAIAAEIERRCVR